MRSQLRSPRAPRTVARSILAACALVTVSGCPDDGEPGALLPSEEDAASTTSGRGGGTGSDVSTGPGVDTGDGGGGLVVQPGFGQPCQENADCPSGWCVETPGGKPLCTQTCLDACPAGWVCQGVTNTGQDVTFICVQTKADLCVPCAKDSECGGKDDRCVVIEAEGGFCSRACSALNPCPEGYACKEDPTGAGAQCHPVTASCVCTAELLGTQEPCKAVNELGTCWGFKRCIGPGGWDACDARTPTQETCDGVDNDCDGETDEGTSGAPCTASGALGTCHGTYHCTGGAQVCDAVPPSPEICDGLDNDCDGETDEHEGDVDGDGIPDCSDDDIDGDGDPNVTDCDAWDPTRWTGAPEICDGLDNDCDGQVPLDEVDADGDGLWGCQGDCDDTKSEVHPGAPEICDGLDNDCDQTLGPDEVDSDADGYLACGGDCADDDAERHPGAQELCNGVDDDCDGHVDESGAEGCVPYFVDQDGDGAGGGEPRCLCAPETAFTTTVGGDCDDDNPDVSPLASESCNGVDDDCDGATDEAGAEGCLPYLLDLDGDGWGAVSPASCLCAPPPDGGADQPGDCDDTNPDIHPGQPEICDGVDTNCDNILPEEEADEDEDGWPKCAGDCEDLVPTVHPGAEEVCDGFDSDCDGILPDDEHDDDKDGWPKCAGDCNDWNDQAWPGAPEVCGGGDENCDGVADEPGAVGCTAWYPDGDGDGFGPSDLGLCLCAPTAVNVVPYGGDCDDTDPLEKPGANAPCTEDADCCQPAMSCRYGFCVPGPAACGDDDDCWDDAYCEVHECIPYGIGPGAPSDPVCKKQNEAGLFLPTLQCQWTGPPDGDAFPNHKNVLGTPMVADFDLDNDPGVLRPSVVFVSYEGQDGGFAAASSNGVIRVLDGQDCTQLFTLGAQKVVGAAPVAIADLDLAPDERPEIVAFREGGGLVAFKYDADLQDFAVHWVATTPAGATSTLASDIGRWNGPTVVELDGDAFPEVMMGSVVFDHDGHEIGGNLGYQSYSQGLFDVVADVDGDGAPEYVNGASVYRWTGSGWAQEAYVTTANALGHVAVADFGSFPVAGLAQPIAEVAVIRAGKASIQDLSGKTVFGPYALLTWPPGTDIGTGGPPTVGDFDGDGVPELAAAGKGAYTIFDADCTASPLPLGCYAPGVLWFRWSQDYSSSVTGSSIYDFEADGLAEAVYSDECFTRIYEGLTGDVLFSQWRSSCTWYENPVVADTDGDLKAELVVGSNTNCNIQCPSLDPIFRGLPCKGDGDCPGPTGWCDVGRCRCAADSDCGPPESSYVCVDPLPNTPGTGKVCRASHGGPIPGIRVYRDVGDSWVNSRPIWSQHAFDPTRITDRGRVLPAGSVPANWQTEGMNNFRQNAQGAFDPVLAPDLTASSNLILNCDATGHLLVSVDVCNRGALPIAGGVVVGFFAGDPLTIGEVMCLSETTSMLYPEDCETVSCNWLTEGPGPWDVYAWADFGGQKGETQECKEGNNATLWPGVTCTNW